MLGDDVTLGGGSSPHTRGALAGESDGGGGVRIIPAYAGSTSSGPPTTTRHADHPRIRGEHAEASTTHTSRTGSSPHTRGAPIVGGEVVLGLGIIPAYAGSTCSS